jgi:5'-nucleotidase
VWVIAPDRQYSGCGHQVTTHRPIAWKQLDARTYAISGTPADCIRLALFDLCPSPSWILSGINAGGNLGVDAYISGTLAAVREGAMSGIPGVAISQYCDRSAPVNWDIAQQWTSQVLTLLWSKDHQPGTFWNVNLPHWQGDNHHPDIIFCEPSTTPLPLDYAKTEAGYQYQGVYQKRVRSPGTDVDFCFAGNIAVTRLSV